jgi:hypothetical protein
MMRSLVFLSCVGAAIYTLLVITDKMMPVVPDSTSPDIVARQTRLSVWGPYLPDRPLNQKRLASTQQLAPPMQEIASRENAAVRSPPVTLDAPQMVTSSSQEDQIGKQAVSFEPSVTAMNDEAIWFVVSRAARLHAGPSVSSPTVHFYPVGTELRLIGYERGWFKVLDPATSRQGWIYEKYYLEAISGPGQTRVVMQESPGPTRVAVQSRQNAAFAPAKSQTKAIPSSGAKQVKATKRKPIQRRHANFASFIQRGFGGS